MFRLSDRIEVKSNVRIVARERGKIQAVRETHNIFLDVGREWLAYLCSYATLPAVGVAPNHLTDPAELNRVRYMGLGIGSTAQMFPAALFSAPPLDTYGPFTFAQTETDATVSALENPIALGLTGNPAPNDYAWLGQLATPPDYPNTGQVRYSRIFTAAEVNFGAFAMVPVSEVGLFTNAAAYDLKPTGSGAMIAYNTFSPIAKTNAIDLEILWTFRF